MIVLLFTSYLYFIHILITSKSDRGQIHVMSALAVCPPDLRTLAPLIIDPQLPKQKRADSFFVHFGTSDSNNGNIVTTIYSVIVFIGALFHSILFSNVVETL